MGKDCCKEGDEGCGCGHGKEDISLEGIVYNNNFVLNTLIELLIEKKVITEEDLMNKLEQISENLDKETVNLEKK
jgi:hypothetical protein